MATATPTADRGPLSRWKGAHPVLGFFSWFRDDALARRTILLINLAGIAYGFYFYLPQFQVTPWWYWPLVPDSPLAVLWATLALLALEVGRRSRLMEALAFVGNVQVGVWTAFVLLYYGRVVWPRLDFVLFWLHLAMVALALIFVDPLRRDRWRTTAWAVAGAAAYYALNDWADYWFTGYAFQGCTGLHPISIHTPGDWCTGLDVVAVVTVGLTVVSVAWLAVMTLAPWFRRDVMRG